MKRRTVIASLAVLAVMPELFQGGVAAGSVLKGPERDKVRPWEYRKGLHELRNGCWAWLQPDGGWGWSNAGLVEDRGETLLVDTLFDLRLTGEMLAAMERSIPAARHIGTLVNTHVNGDHIYGNQLVKGARIIASESNARALAKEDPSSLKKLLASSSDYGEAGAFMKETFGGFDFDGIKLPPVTQTFANELSIKVGDKVVRLIESIPAHTESDVIVYVPQDRVVYTGDLVFAGGHPVVWSGPVRNWIRTCERMLSWDIDMVVPGHGPIGTKAQISEQRDYLLWLEREARVRFDAGVGFEDAALDMARIAYRDLADQERLIINLATLYQEFSGSQAPPDRWALRGGMARFKQKLGATSSSSR